MEFPFKEFLIDFSFSKPVTYKNKKATKHTVSQKQETTSFEFVSEEIFQLEDILLNGMSVKEHMNKSTRILENASIKKEVFENLQTNLKFEIHQSEWIPFIGPFTRWNDVGDQSSGKSGVFYHITWFGHSKPSKNVIVHGKQYISHDLKLLDHWLMQKRMEGVPGQLRCRVFFMPPWEHLD
jgi:hypothetical protein